MPSPLADEDRRAIVDLRRARDRRRWWVRWLVAAVGLLALALGASDIAERNSDLPGWPELARDGRTIYSATALSGWRGLIADHAPLVRVAKRGVVALNGEIDARVLELAGLALHAAGLALLIALLGRVLRFSTLSLVAATVLGLLLAAGVNALAPLTTFTGTSALVVLSLAHLALMTSARPRTAAWWIGFAAGVMNIACATVGVSSAIALVVWALTRSRRGVGASSDQSVLRANLVLAALGVAIGLVRARTGASDLSVGNAFVSLTRWPFGHSLGALLAWAPAIACAIEQCRSGASARIAPRVGLLAWWMIAAAAALAFTHTPPTGEPLLLVLALVVNAICFTVVRGPALRFVLLAIWSILVSTALFRATPRDRPSLEDSANTIAVFRRALLTQDGSALNELPGSDEDRRAAREILHNPDITPLLPLSIRAPLPLIVSSAGSAGFQPDAVPPLPERDSLPVFGTWDSAGAFRTGELVSEPRQTNASFVQLRIAGTLREPATAVRLRLQSGAELAPLTTTVSATDRWRRVNFTAPHEPFCVIARVTTPAQWLAIAAPLEMGALSRATAKLPRYWPWVLGAGMFVSAAALGALGGLLAGRLKTEQRRLPLSERRPFADTREDVGPARKSRATIPWRAVPWLALFAYFVFFADHIDGTAGPNDSGGYLNSAKLMVNGALTAAPRAIFPGDHDLEITAYLPMTFHANGDRMVPEYPVGFPLEVAFFGKLLGLARGVPTLIMLQLVLGVIVTQRCARALGLPEGWAWLAAGVVGLSPVYLFEGLQPVSDVPALVWVTTAVYFAWQSRARPWLAVLAGLALALAVMIRPSNLLGAVPVFLCLIGCWRQTTYCALAGIPGAAWLAWYQHALYGSWRTTGYGDIHTSFAFEFIRPTLQSYAMWLPELLTPLVVLGFAGPFVRTIPGRVRLVLTAWAAVFLAFYATYWCTWDNWYNMRFVLPAFPAMIILALFVVKNLAERFGLALFASGRALRTVIPTAALVIASLGFAGLRTSAREIVYWMHANHKPREVSVWLRDHIPANAVVFAKHITGSLFYYTDLTFVRLDYEPALNSTAIYERIEAAGRPIYAMTCHWETPGYTWGHGRGTGYPGLPGNWERIAALGEGDFLVWRWHPPQMRP